MQSESPIRPRLRMRRSLFVFLMVCAMLPAGGCPPTMPGGGNVAPVAQDVEATVQEGLSSTVTLDAQDAEGDMLTFTITSLPVSGTLNDAHGTPIDEVPFVLPDASAIVRYQPAAGFTGNDVFSYQASDGEDDSSEADVNITVSPLTPTITISADESMESFIVEAEDVVLVENNARIAIAGETRIEGLVLARTGRVTIEAMGDLTISGSIRAVDSDLEEIDPAIPLGEQPTGIVIVVGAEAATFEESAVLETNGNVVITDNAEVVDQTPEELFDEVEDVSGDDLPTLVPLPEDNPAFDTLKAVEINGDPTAQQAMLPPVTIGGTWPPPGAAPVPGDKPVVIARFAGPRDVNLDGWTVNGPPAPPGRDTDNSMDAGMSATGRGGRNGMRLNIRNNGGGINIVGTVTLNLTDGGAGGDATAVCASATGGDGGNAGNFRMTASGGVNLSGGMLVINPGSGGAGGNATVTAGPAGAAGCPGEAGDNSTATGGNGANNRKRLLVRGNVTSPTNIAIGPLGGGAGGMADATACDGGDGIACCDGGSGGTATARGGDGGDASLNVSGLAIATGLVTGGAGGAATTTGGAGGNGGDCKFDDGGDGADGGAATATGGMGGDAANSGSGGAAAGSGGDATATGGDGGNGGDSGLGEPGEGGSGGTATATPGAAGMGSTAGSAGTPDPADGFNGAAGGDIPIFIFCFPFNFLPTVPGPIQPGPTEGPIFADDGVTELGTLPIEFVPMEGAQYERGRDPDHIGIWNGVLLINAAGLSLDEGQPGIVAGLRIEPLDAPGINENNPVIVEALNAEGQVIDTVALTSIPRNIGSTGAPETVDALFETSVSVSAFRVVFPPNAFVTITRFYLIDP